METTGGAQELGGGAGGGWGAAGAGGSSGSSASGGHPPEMPHQDSVDDAPSELLAPLLEEWRDISSGTHILI